MYFFEMVTVGIPIPYEFEAINLTIHLYYWKRRKKGIIMVNHLVI